MRSTFFVTPAAFGLTILALTMLSQAGPAVGAQTPTATPAPRIVTIPASAAIERGGSVTFRRPSDGATLTVRHDTNSDATSTTVRHDGTALTIDAGESGFEITALRMAARVPPPCTPLGGPGRMRSVLRCDLQPSAEAPTLTFGVGPTANPTPSPPPSPRPTPTPRGIPIPGETTIAPDESVIFRRPADNAALTVSYRGGPEPATATYDGAILIVSVPSLGLGDVLVGVGPGTLGGVSPTTCTPVNNQRNVMRCEVQSTLQPRLVEFRIERAIPSGTSVSEVAIPGEATVTQERAVIFRRRSDNAALIVTYSGGPGPATVTYDGETLTATVPSLPASWLLSVGSPRGSCGQVESQRNVYRCTIRPSVEGEVLRIGVAIGDPPPTPVTAGRICADWLTPDGRIVGRCFPNMPDVPSEWESVPLTAGCNNVASTLPNGTAPERIIESMTLPLQVEAIWRLDAATRRFIGWSLTASLIAPEVNDLTALSRLDAVFICVRQPATLYRPPA